MALFQQSHFAFRILAFSMLSSLAIPAATAATITSTGNGNWNAAATWGGAGPPVAGDTAQIGNGHNIVVTANATCANLTLLTGGTANSVTVNNNITLAVTAAVNLQAGTGSGDHRQITLAGANSVFTCASLTMVDTTNNNRACRLNVNAGTATVTGTITLNGNNTRNQIVFTGGMLDVGAFAGAANNGGLIMNAGGGTLNVPAGTATFSGIVSGAGDVLKTGAGTLAYATANTCTGSTTVSNGTLQLNANNAIAANTDVIVNAPGILNVGTSANTFNTLTLAGGIVNGTGTITLSGTPGTTLITNASNVTAVVNAPLALNGTDRLWSIALGTTASGIDCQINGVISNAVGQAWARKVGDGQLVVNTNTTATAIDMGGGTLAVGDNAALGTAADTWVYSAAPPLFIRAFGGARTIGKNPLIFQQTATLGFDGTDDLTWNGAFTQAGGATGTVVKEGTMTMTVGGAASTYTGTTTVNSGVLQLNKAAGSDAFAGPLVIGDGTGTDTVRLLQSNQIPAVTVTVNRSGALDLNGQSDAIGALNLESGPASGASVSTGAGTLTLGGDVTQTVNGTGSIGTSISGNLALGANRAFTVANGLAVADLTVSSVVTGGFNLQKDGVGTMVMSGANTYTGTTSVLAGELYLVDAGGAQTGVLAAGAGTTTVSVGALLGGSGNAAGTSGRVRALVSNGMIAPGTPSALTGILNASNSTLNNGSAFGVNIDSTGAGTGHDQLNVNGTVALNTPTLSVLATAAYIVAQTDSDTFTIVNNDAADAVTGTFAGLAAGSAVLDLSGNAGWTIAYNGGTGNDVVLSTIPIVTNVTSTTANGTYGPGATIVVTVTFSLSVAVTGTPQLTLETGASDAVVNYTSGSGTSTLVFTYTVAAGHSSLDLDYLSTNALSLNGGTIRSTTTARDARLVLAAPGAPRSLGFNKNIVISAPAPVITARETVDADGNGRIDAIRIVTDQPLSDNFAGLNITVGGYTLAGAPYDTGGTAGDAEFFVRLVEQALPPFAGDTVATPAVTVVAGGGLGLSAGAGVAATDKAKPVLLKAEWINLGSADGVDAGDEIDLTFSEPVTTNNVVLSATPLASDLELPVSNDSWDTSSLANQGPSALVAIALAGAPRLSPGGTYAPASLTAGSPSGIYVRDGTRILDQAAVPNTALVQAVATAIDILPGAPAVIAVAWSDHSVAPLSWDLGEQDVAMTFTAATTVPPLILGVVNAGNVRSRFDAFVSPSSPSGWTASSSTGVDRFEMKMDASVPLDNTFELDLSAGTQVLAIGIYSGFARSFDLQFSTPTEITVGADVPQTIVVTVVVTQD